MAKLQPMAIAEKNNNKLELLINYFTIFDAII